jgi:hypothetical protein
MVRLDPTTHAGTQAQAPATEGQFSHTVGWLLHGGVDPRVKATAVRFVFTI